MDVNRDDERADAGESEICARRAAADAAAVATPPGDSDALAPGPGTDADSLAGPSTEPEHDLSGLLSSPGVAFSLPDVSTEWSQGRPAAPDPGRPTDPSVKLPTLDGATFTPNPWNRFDLDTLKPADGPAPAPHHRPPGPDYEILSILGRGGMGVVYKARQVGLDRIVALKMIVGGGHARPEELQRFHAEALAVARIHHPNIVQIHEVGERDGLPFFSLEFVEGGTLGERIDGEPQPHLEAARIVEILARAMQFAHERGVIHRDLKPANILMTTDGQPKISDFGLAKRIDGDAGQTRTGAVLGTPSYMAPEQAEGRTKELGPRADLYSLGAILYELISGRPPFRGTTLFQTLEMVKSQDPVPLIRLLPNVPRDLETICFKCLQKDPAKRYDDCAALAEDLRRFRAKEPILARPVSAPERAWRWCRRNPRMAALLAALALLLVGWGATSSALALSLAFQKNRAVQAENRADERRILAEQAGDEAFFQMDEAIKGRAAAEEQANVALDVIRGVLYRIDAELADRASMQGVRRSIAAIARGDLRKVASVTSKHGLEGRTAAKIHQVLGHLSEELGDVEDAFLEHQATYGYVEKLARKEPRDDAQRSVSIRNFAAAKNVLGDVFLRYRDDPAKARGLYAEALELRKQWQALNPDHVPAKQALGVSYGLLAIADLRSGDPGRAASELEESLRWHRAVPIDPNDRYYHENQRDWAGLYDRLGEAAFKLGNPEAAIAYYEEARKIREALAKRFTRSVHSNRDLALSQMHLGDVIMFLKGEPAASLRHYAEALGYLDRSLESDPDSAFVQQYLGNDHYRLGMAHLRMGNVAASQDDLRRSLAYREKLRDGDPQGPQANIGYAVSLGRTGNHQLASQLAGAVRKAVGKDPGMLFLVATAYSVCIPAAAEARDGEREGRDRAAAYADEAIEALRAAVDTGYRDLVAMQTDPDLDPLRRDPRFGRIESELKSQGIPGLKRP